MNPQSRGHEFKANCRWIKNGGNFVCSTLYVLYVVFWMGNFYKVIDPFSLICISEHSDYYAGYKRDTAPDETRAAIG